MRLPPTRCWLHPAVEVRSSGIDGSGLFTIGAIAEGQTVSVLGGTVITDADVRRMIARRSEEPSLPYVDSITLGDDRNLLLSPGAPNRYGNHSCDPNTWWTDEVTLVARRPIAAGEEVTNDYGTSTVHAGWSMDCRCGSSNCRRTITGTDWRRRELRGRYGDHWVPVLRRLIEADDVD